MKRIWRLKVQCIRFEQLYLHNMVEIEHDMHNYVFISIENYISYAVDSLEWAFYIY